MIGSFNLLRHLLGVAIGILASTLVAFALGFSIGLLPSMRGESEFHTFDFAWFLGGITALGAAPLIASVGLALCFPLHVLAIRINWVRGRDYTAVGAAVGILIYLVAQIIERAGVFNIAIPGQMKFVALPAAPLLGAVFGFSFWAIVRPDKIVAQ